MTDSYLRYPHLHSDLLTFVAEDDVWLAPVAGGRAWRLTADLAPVSSPRFSPDGTRVAWASTRDGEPEVHVAPTDGGASTRLTYWGDARTGVLGWTPGGEVVAGTCAGSHAVRNRMPYALPAEGGPARRLPYGPVGGVAFGSGGAVALASYNSREPAMWKRYRGGTAGKLWLDASGDGRFERLLADLDGNLECPMWVAGRLVFLSDHEGVGSVYSCAPDGTDLRRHSKGEFYARHASTDGERVVYESAGRLWLLADLDATPAELPVVLSGPRSSRQPCPILTGENLGAYAVDRTARASVVEVRGTVHWLTHRDGPARVLAAEPGVRGRMPVVVGDTGLAAWVTDADGEDAVEFARVDGSERAAPHRRIAGGQLGRVLNLQASPDGRRLAVVSHDGRLLLVEVESGDIREVARAAEGEPSSPAFSPDSRWLAWSHPGPEPMRQVRIAPVDSPGAEPVAVTELRFRDTDPVFTADGKYLAFLSVRTYDPIYDVHSFDMSFPHGCRPYLVPLAADTPSPFAPSSAGRASGDEDKGGHGDSSGDGSSDEVPRTDVDVEGIAERVVPLPVEAADYGALRAASDGLLWLRQPLAGELGDTTAGAKGERPHCSLERFDFGKRRAETLRDRADSLDVSGDGKKVVVEDGLRLLVVPSDKKVDDDGGDPDDSEDRVDVDLSRVRVTVDPEAEWRQAYDEAGRLMRDNFWRPDMSGVDWQAQLARYRPLVDRVGSHDDLIDLLWEVQGELGTSHAYVMPESEGVEGRLRQGLLGADLRRDDEGVWRVARVLPSETSDPKARSPLRAPGVNVREGDAVLAVDGRSVDPRFGPSALLVGAAGKAVELTVSPAAGGAERRVVVVPLADDMPLRYQAWVAGRREHVRAASEGRLGYLHVPDMLAQGWAQLHRDLRVEARRDGLIVDLRDNRGGHLSQLIVEKLARRVIGWQIARDGYAVEAYPDDAPRGPIVALANENSGSDGDIGTAAIKARGIAPVVGMRTWGGVIGIDMRYHLVDGTLVTQPKFATWMSGPGWGVENYGVDPDVEVPMAPHDWAADRDPQLDTAVRMALDALTSQPPAVPPELPPARYGD